MASNETKHVAIIGAGISGIVSAAHLLRRNVNITIFERNSSAGGVWVYNENLPPEPTYPAISPSKGDIYTEDIFEKDIPGPCHPGLRNNVGTRLMKTSLLDWPEGTPDYTTHDVMKTYIQELARVYDIEQHIRYRTNVLKIEKQGKDWSIRTKSRRRDSLVTESRPEPKSEVFDAVIVATGHYHAPRIPDIPGLSELKRLSPKLVMHSKGYRGAESFAGKNVLLIGTGASAVDIARDAAPLAKTIYHSWRHGKFDVPLSMFSEQVKHIGEIVKVENLDVANDSDSGLNARFHLVDGSTLCNVDVLILCTGYHVSLPFLSNYHDDDMPVDSASEDILITDGTMYHNLHKDIFYIPDPSLLFIGVPYFTANFSLFDFQAQVAATVLANIAPLPSRDDMRIEYNAKLAEKGAGKQFHSLRGVEVEYVQELLAWVNPYLVQAGQQPLAGHTAEWMVARDELTERLKGLLSAPHASNYVLAAC